ncbi:MAG TPA: hypothetical protein VMB47_00275 [Candidatus Aquilonibacter sp.]|nr:hypothetical protein [Candidatus Aquilonibacter sp.]
MTTRRIATLAACWLALAGGSIAQSSKPDLVIRGQLSAAESFQRDIGHNLIFRLVPSPASFGKGWDIQIVPKGSPAGGFEEYATVATPPYHSYKPTYLNASYGVTAQQAVAMSPRKFQFVETPADSQAAAVVVNTMVYSVDWPAHKAALESAAQRIPVGAGELKIIRARTTPGKNNEDLGSIEWIRFQISLWLRSGVTLKDVLFPGVRSSDADPGSSAVGVNVSAASASAPK